MPVRQRKVKLSKLMYDSSHAGFTVMVSITSSMSAVDTCAVVVVAAAAVAADGPLQLQVAESQPASKYTLLAGLLLFAWR